MPVGCIGGGWRQVVVVAARKRKEIGDFL